jgi:septal ring factor EnvC (AmiA/AmiB activator)
MTDKPKIPGMLSSAQMQRAMEIARKKTPQMPTYSEAMGDAWKETNDSLNKMAERREKMDSTQLRQTELLEQIAVNTASLQDIATTLHESNMKQDEIVELMGDIFAIASAKDKAAAENMYQRAIGKISGIGEQVGNIANLVTLATSVYNAIGPLIH